MIEMTRKEYESFSRIIKEIYNGIDNNMETRGKTAFVWTKLEENDKINLFAVGLQIAAIVKGGEVIISDDEFRIKE